MHEHFDGKKAFLHILKLSSSGRSYGSQGERLARVYLKAVVEDMAVPFNEEKFYFNCRTRKAIEPVFCLMIAAFCFAGSVSYLLNEYCMLVIGVLILLVTGLPIYKRELLGRLGVFKGNDVAINLESRIAGGRKSGTIIICAHYDSKSQGLPLTARITLLIFGLMSVMLQAAALIVLGFFSISGADIAGSMVVYFVMLVPSCVFVALAMDRAGNNSPGALDNASGVAIVLELLSTIRAQPLENFELRAVLFDAEELGLCGSSNYVRAHKSELAAGPCFVLNFDMP
ncbi:MAG: M28 family peptidase, partial [Actinobacteria bacterium]|nr:M28 family peptidase [Actinomycetota bacterium]